MRRLHVIGTDIPVHLTPRERDVLRLILGGCTTAEIVTLLDVSHASVVRTTRTLVDQFQALDRRELVAELLAQGYEPADI